MKVLMLAKIDSSHTRKWALALKEQGVQIALFSIHVPDERDDWYKKLDFVYFPGKKIVSRGLWSKFSYISLFFSLRQVIKTFKPDILHSHFATHYSFLGVISGFKKHVITVWGSDVYVFPKKRSLNKRLFMYNVNRAKCLISTSVAMAKEMSLYTSKPIEVIPFGVDFDFFKPLPALNVKQETVIGNIKSLEPIYGIDILIYAFDEVKKRFPLMALRLVIVGSGSKINEYKKLTTDLGIEPHVTFTGNVIARDIPAILNTFDIFACLSRNESFGVSVIEAMACKIPVVVSRTPGFLEVVNSEDNGLFVEINNSKDAADKISCLISNKQLATSNAAKAFERADSLYKLSENIKQQIELYQRLI